MEEEINIKNKLGKDFSYLSYHIEILINFLRFFSFYPTLEENKDLNKNRNIKIKTLKSGKIPLKKGGNCALPNYPS